MVRDSGGHINAPHGLSHTERDHLAEAMDHLRQRGAGIFVSIEAGRSTTAETNVRRLARRVRSDVAQLQRRARMRCRFAVQVFEARGRDGLPKFGAHVVGVLPNAAARDKAIESLDRSGYAQSGLDTRPCVLVEPVSDWAGLTRYLFKDLDAQAAFRRGFVGSAAPSLWANSAAIASSSRKTCEIRSWGLGGSSHTAAPMLGVGQKRRRSLSRRAVRPLARARLAVASEAAPGNATSRAAELAPRPPADDRRSARRTRPDA